MLEERTWPEELIKRLELVAQIFTNALIRKQTEMALRVSEERLKDVTFSMAEWVWEVDEKGVYTYSSSKGKEIFGNVIGKTPFDFMPPDEAKRVAAIFSEIAANKAPIKDLENWNITENGKRICLLTSGVPLLDEEGNLKGYRGVDKDITGRKQIEETLRKSEARYQRLYESMMDAFVVVDLLSGRIQEFNPAYQQMLGYSEAELRELSYEEITPKRWHAAEDAIVRDQVLVCGYSDVYEKEYRRKDGTIFPVELRTFLIRDDSGKPVAMSAIVRDITERKQIELQLSESQALLSSLIDSTTDMIWSVDAEHFGLLTFNRGLYERFLNAYGIQIKGGERPEDLFTAEDYVQQWHMLYRRALEEGSFTTEYKAYAEGRTIRLNFNILKHEDVVFGISVFSEDITERKKMEMQLSESQTLLSSLINSTSDLIWSVDPERFSLIVFNRGLSEYFLHGTGLHIKAGMTPNDLLPKEFAEQWQMLYRRALEEGSFTTEYQASTQAKTLRLNLNTLKNGDVVFGISVFAQDFTSRKKLEEQLRQSLEKVQQLKDQLQKENIYLREEVKSVYLHTEIVGDSRPINDVIVHAEKVAPTDSTVLLLGETGTGKELIAHAIHDLSIRKDRIASDGQLRVLATDIDRE